MANQFETLGIVVSSTNRPDHSKTPDQGEWARGYFGESYAKDLPQLNRELGGYPDQISFMESSIKLTVERYDPNRNYESLEYYPTVLSLLHATMQTDKMIHVLCWGSLTEPALLVNHLVSIGRTDLLKKLWFIAH